jgi:hypothetical protein
MAELYYPLGRDGGALGAIVRFLFEVSHLSRWAAWCISVVDDLAFTARGGGAFAACGGSAFAKWRDRAVPA